MSIDNTTEIKLAGRGTFHLKPSLKAAQVVNRLGVGFIAVQNALFALNLDMHVAVAKAGLADDRTISSKDIEQAIWETGMTETIAPLSDFVRSLQNGGKKDAPDAKADEGDGDQNAEGGQGNG